MISWNSPIFASEIAHEVRQIYIMQIQSGRDAWTAMETVMNLYQSKERSKETAPIFWLSLAAAQLECHHILPEVRSQALAWINQMLSVSEETLPADNDEDISACLRDICALKCWILREKTILQHDS